MIIVSHPTGNENVKALLRGITASGQLLEFQTTLGFSSDFLFPGWIPSSIRRELDRRRYPITHERIVTHPLREFVRLASMRTGVSSLIQSDNAWASIYSVYRDLDNHLSLRIRKGIKAVYCYEDGAHATFKAAHRYRIP
jgi:hypothetical protein